MAANDIQVLQKRPNESRLYDFEFLPKLEDDSEVILSVTHLSSSPSGLTVGSPSIGGSRVQVRLADGIDGGKYLQTCRVLTDRANTLQVDGWLSVREATQ